MQKGTPEYVLKAEELIRAPAEPGMRVAKYLTAAVIVGLTAGSLAFGENLFAGLSWSLRLLLIAAVIAVLVNGRGKRIASPFEIWFYEDFLIVYRDKDYFSPRLQRRTYDKFYYRDIRQIKYRTVSNRFNIYGIVEGEWYDYNKDGTLPPKPTYHRTEDSLCYFYPAQNSEIDFEKEFERRASIAVVREDT